MDFKFLDKPEYSNIPIYNVTKDNRGTSEVFIAKYTLMKEKQLHRHKGMQINYIHHGKATHIINGCEFEYVRGDISIILPYVPNLLIPSSCDQTQVIEFEFLPEFISQNFVNQVEKSFFDFAYLEPFISYENQVKNILNLSGSTQVEVERLLEEAYREYKAGQTGFALVVKSILLKLLVIMGREFSKQRMESEDDSVYVKHKEAVNNALKYIDENYINDISIGDVAKVVSFSTSYFSYLFRLATSSSFTEYIINMRMRKAMELLKDSDAQVLDISQQVGYNNVSYFNKLFKEKTNQTPTQFRKRK